MSPGDYHRAVRTTEGIGERESYTVELAGLWNPLSSALTRLDALAARPDRLAEGTAALESLPRLQYVLHAASETAAGIEPPADAEFVHADLSAALADARDLTAELYANVVVEGSSGVSPLLYEWRGALFRVRLARLRLAARQEPVEAPSAEEPRASARTALLATLLVLIGTAAFAVGAVLDAWPLWSAGLSLFAAGGCFVYRGHG